MFPDLFISGERSTEPGRGWSLFATEELQSLDEGLSPVQGGPPTLTGEALGAPSIWPSLERSELPRGVSPENTLGEAQSARGRTEEWA